MAAIGWRIRVRSWFDSTMDRGTPALIGWLGLASLALVAVATGLSLMLAPAKRAEPGTGGGASRGPACSPRWTRA